MKVLGILLVGALCFLNSSQAAILAMTSGDVKFTATGKPGFLKIKGESKKKGLEGELNIEKTQASGKFTLDLSVLDTGIDLRNSHMKEKYLEVQKFPKAVIVINPIALSSDGIKSDIKKEFTGKLTLHDVTRDIKGTFQFENKLQTAKAQFTIKVSDFKIDVPKYLGITVSESVDVEVDIAFKQK